MYLCVHKIRLAQIFTCSYVQEKPSINYIAGRCTYVRIKALCRYIQTDRTKATILRGECCDIARSREQKGELQKYADGFPYKR